MITMEVSDIERDHRGLLLSLCQSEYASNDPELLFESPCLLRLKNPLSYNCQWRRSPEALLPFLCHVPEANTLAAQMHAHYATRLPLDIIESLTDLLRLRPWSKRGVLQVWKPEDLHREVGSACFLSFWFRRTCSVLEGHGHMRACDAFRKLPADIAIACEVYADLARRLDCVTQSFVLWVDCAHLYKSDRSSIERALVAGE